MTPIKRILLPLVTSATLAAQTSILHIDLAAPVAKVSPNLHGLMTEEINYSYDGGLYGELIRNRNFCDDEKKPVHWTLIESAAADGIMALTDKRPLTDKLPISLELQLNTSPDKPVSIANEGYWGIPVRPKTTYKASFYVKGNLAETATDKPAVAAYVGGPLKISLQTADGSKILAQATTGPITGSWQKMEVALTTSDDITPSAANKFVISANGVGTLWFSLISLFPPTYNDRPNGNRVDLSEKLAALSPKFLRFPGGNYLEGNTLWERFAWKETRGPLPFRSGHHSCWGYRSTDGMGLLEFMLWCEDLKMEPVLGVFAGYSLQQQPVEAGPLLDHYVQEALEEIEYLTGDASTSYWAGLRAKDGHPEPFKLRYVEIGNEDYFDLSHSYEGRFAQFFDAIRARYPGLLIIGSHGVKTRQPDVIDEHFYRSAEDFYKDLAHYDKHDRKGPKIFVGEWATSEGDPTPNFNAALGDAAWMIAMERNSDLIIMHAYAPLLVNVNPGGMQWKTNLIGYDALTSYGSPSYYAQVMFSNNIGDEILKTKLEAAPEVFLAVSATRKTVNNKIYLKVVNPRDTPRDLTVAFDGANGILPNGTITTLHADKPTDTNSITEPEKIIPHTAPLKHLSTRFPHTFPAYSITVMEISGK